MSGPAAGEATDRLRANARAFPDRRALVYPVGRTLSGRAVYRHATYREMDEAADLRARELRAAGIGAGTTTALLVRPGPELFAVAFGLIRVGAVPVIADPGLGLRRMLRCHRDAGAEAFVGIPAAHLVRLGPGRRAFTALRTRVTVGRRWLWGGPRLRALAWGTGAATAGIPAEPVRQPPLGDEDLLAVSFTTGSTGPARAVEHPRGMVEGLIGQLGDVLGQRADDTSLVTVPLWGVLGLLAGSTCVLPPGDPSRVAAIRPRDVVDAIDRFGVSTMFASPALLDRLGAHAARTGRTLEGLRRVSVGGAPVREDIAAAMCAALGPRGEHRLTVVYGATEALPISTIDAAQARATAAATRGGAGVCVGPPAPGVRARVVELTDDPVPRWSADLEAPPHEVGEIAVTGPTVSVRYHADPEADRRTKITDGPRVWHRTGDLGRIDPQGRIWFYGRKSQRVRTAETTLYTVQCESVLNAHPDVRRTALVGVGEPGAARPVVCVEPRRGLSAREHPRLKRQLRELAARHAPTRGLRDFLCHRGFPVDVRHNAKIDREALAGWAAARLAEAERPLRRTAWHAARAVPLAGWALLLHAAVWPPAHPALQALVWAAAVLNVGVHGLQLPAALPRARRAGYGRAATLARTLLFGATWWRRL